MNVSEGLAKGYMEIAYQLLSWRFSRDAMLDAAGAAAARATIPVRMAAVLIMVAVLEELDTFDGCANEDGLSGYGWWKEDGELDGME
jgi:hypothetical protein